ncbi:hypothetical protein K492DRAFT_173510 [Lichtheimia hyalospora FSU 10163]|nr:hypothetical protein K492DRAFT_173510 [Lichtheimia hyalospora FSU 10163]
MLPSGGTGEYQQDDSTKSTTEQTRSYHDMSSQYHQQRLLNDEPLPTFMTATHDDSNSMHHHQYLIDTAQQQQQEQQPFYQYYLGENDDDVAISGSSVPMFLSGRHEHEQYDPTLTPLPGPSRTSSSLAANEQHIWEQQVAAMEQAAAMEQHQQQEQVQAMAVQAAAAVALDDLEYAKEQQQCQEQALFGRLVSMARAPGSSNSSCIATHDDSWSPGIHSIQYAPTWTTPPATTPTTMMDDQSSRSEPLHSKQDPIMSSDLLQDAQFELKVVQQPSRARMCGFGDKDRRPISPPPIVQLIARASDGTLIPARDIDTSFLIVFCDCWQQDMAKPANMVYSASSSSSSSAVTGSHTSSSIAMRNLVGACVATGAKLYNVDGEFGIFYVFHDLSLRSEGKFRLLFSLLNIGTSLIHSSNITTTSATITTANTIAAAETATSSPSLSSSPKQHTVNTRSISNVVTTTFSDVFIAYTAKTFPGVVSPTALSQCFAKQGVKIPIRSDTKPRGTSRKRNSSTTTTITTTTTTTTTTTSIADPFHSQTSN